MADDRKERALRAVDRTLPYAAAGLAGGTAGLWAGVNMNRLREAAARHAAGVAGGAEAASKVVPPGARVPLALAVLGTALGLGQQHIRSLSHKPKYENVLKETRRSEQ